VGVPDLLDLHLFLTPVEFVPPPRFAGFCASALPAAAFECLPVRPSLSVFDAADAALAEVCFFGALVCERALPAAAFDLPAVELLLRTFDAALEARLPVTFPFAICPSS
jgi:hypothetical protein